MTQHIFRFGLCFSVLTWAACPTVNPGNDSGAQPGDGATADGAAGSDATAPDTDASTSSQDANLVGLDATVMDAMAGDSSAPDTAAALDASLTPDGTNVNDAGPLADAGSADGGDPCASAIPACEAYCRMVCDNCGSNPGAQNACGWAQIAAGGGVCSACLANIDSWASTCPAPDPMPTCAPPPPDTTTGTLEATVSGSVYHFSTGLFARYEMATATTFLFGRTDAQDEYISITIPADHTGTFHCGQGLYHLTKIEFTSPALTGAASQYAGSCTVTVDAYGAVGNSITGSFSATLEYNNEGSSGQFDLSAGTFDLIRQDDQ